MDETMTEAREVLDRADRLKREHVAWRAGLEAYRDSADFPRSRSAVLLAQCRALSRAEWIVEASKAYANGKVYASLGPIDRPTFKLHWPEWEHVRRRSAIAALILEYGEAAGLKLWNELRNAETADNRRRLNRSRKPRLKDVALFREEEPLSRSARRREAAEQAS